MDFPQYLKDSTQDINQEIESFFKGWNQYVGKVSPKFLPLLEAFAKCCNGGKGLRGTLVRLGFELAGGKDTAEIIKPAAAVEILNTALLAHDDIIDLSPTRRGKPTLYRALGGDHYGISQAICLGDLGFFLAEKLVQDSGFADTLKNKAISSFIQTMIDTAMGEMLDVELPHLADRGSEGDVLTIFHLKTARYTIVGPLHLGAILGGADEALLSQLVQLGESLGIAFQIQDDILGVFGDEGILGKSVTSDIEEGKQTLLISYALEHADKMQNEVLKKYYGQGKVDDGALRKIREVFIQTGALEYSQKKANLLVVEAKRIINNIEAHPQKRQLLYEMSDYIINRLK